MTDGHEYGDIKGPGDREDDERQRAAEPANAVYTGNPCVQCGRIRVFLRRDGQFQCEKCETIQRPPSGEPPEQENA